MKIQDVEVQTGLDRATIRYYEKEGLLQPHRADNGYRCYTQEDVQLLQKIKLLRSLGVSLFTIKSLQQGSEDLDFVLGRQIKLLEQQIQSDTRSRQVCIQMHQDRVQYATLDTERYLQMLYALQTTSYFQETVNTEQHPVRRFLARVLDLDITYAAVLFLFVVVIRIRPIEKGTFIFLRILSYALAIPIEAMMLHFCGTTPGKWLLGLHLEDVNGGKLSFSNAMTRTWHVVLFGWGLYVPFFSLWRLIRSYCDVTSRKGTYWEEEAEFQYKDLKLWKNCSAAVLALLIPLSLYLSSQDAVLPARRGQEMTMKDFIANYQDYQQLFQTDNTMVLSADGTWIEQTRTDIEIIQIGNTDHIRQDFQYTFDENGNICSVSFSDQWDDIHFQTAIPDHCRIAIYTVVGSQKGSTAKDLTQVDEYFATQLSTALSVGGLQKGSFKVGHVTVNWSLELPEGEYYYYSGMIFQEGDTKIPYSFQMSIVID